MSKENSYQPGDILKINGNFAKSEIARNWNGFDNRKYLKQQKIEGISTVEKYQFQTTKKDFYYLLGNIQNRIKEQIEKLYPKEDAGFMERILWGMQADLSAEIEENFRDAGISHVLAISGLHISYIVFFLQKILEKSIQDRKMQNRIICICLILFLFITGFPVSCMRACMMNIMILLSENTYRKNNVWRSMFVAFLIILLSNIYNIYYIGMWLSFLGTLGILLFHKCLYTLCSSKKYKKWNAFIDSILVSLSAQILIWPIIAYVFNTISFSFWISNIAISILIGPIIVLGYISILFSYVCYPVGKLVAILEKFLLSILFFVAKICSQIPFSKIYITGSCMFVWIIYYMLLCFCIVYFHRNKRKTCRVWLSFKKADFRKKFIKKIFRINIVMYLILMITICEAIGYIHKNFQINFVDVGQGDCTIIRTPHKNMIIDGGEGNSEKYDYGKGVVLQHLLKMGIRKIDYLVVSHFDSDHAGGLIYLLENLKVDTIFFGIQSEKSDCLEKLLTISKQKHIPVIVLEAGMHIPIDTKCYMEVLWPKQKEWISDNPLNNNSLVFQLHYENLSMLFTGDIEALAEEKLVEMYQEKLKCNILKVAHHGSKTSSTEAFLKLASPEIALIGVGKNNKFGHPSPETVEHLEYIGTKIYRTDLCGEIILDMKKKHLKMKTKLNEK